jgi:multicomponent Na+:H+ antiporter subunit D
MSLLDLPPSAFFFGAALLVPLIRGHRLRAALLLLVPVLGAASLLWQEAGSFGQVQVLDYTLTLFRVDRLSLLFGYLFNLAAFIAILFSIHLKREDDATLQHTSGLLYAGSGLGAVFAGDLITLFVFWELLALTSVFLVWARRSERSLSSGVRYLVVNVLSGVLLLAGALIHAHRTGSIAFGYLGLDGPASWLIFLAFGIKAGFPLLHSWLIDAYPEATPTGTVFLSAFTTKVAVYALARAFPGVELLIWIGVIMTCFPIFYAVIENDLRRVLSYSMINQIGFMVVGIGLGTALSINGAVAHAFVDVLFKGLLMMSMGAVLLRTGTVNGTDLGGLYKTMPLTASFSLVGAASISALPLFSGFVSKSMVMAAALYEGYPWVWVLLLFASAGVVEHAGIKIPFFSFFAHDSGSRTKEPPANMLLAMGLAAVLCIGIGTFPQWTVYPLLPFPVEYLPYDATHVITQLQLLFFSSLGVFWMMKLGWYPPEKRGLNLDADWAYRWLAPKAVSRLGALIGRIDRHIRRRAVRALGIFLRVLGRSVGPSEGLSRHYPTGSMVLWVSVLLAAYLLFYFL